MRCTEICRAGPSWRMTVDLDQVTLGRAVKEYAARCAAEEARQGWKRQRYVHPLDDLCCCHYVGATVDLLPEAGIAYRRALFDLDFPGGKDPKENIHRALEALRKLVVVLVAHSVPFAIYFSGSKGFGVEIPGVAFWPLAQDGTLVFVKRGNFVLKRMVRAIFEEAGVPEGADGGWDPAIYNARAPVRIPGVPHSKSRSRWGRTLYRTLLPPTWASMSVEEIIRWSETPRPRAQWDNVARCPWLEEQWALAKAATDDEPEDRFTVYGQKVVREARRQHGYPPCIHSIRNGVLRQRVSIRNTTGIAVCSYHAAAGQGLSVAISTMEHVSSRAIISQATAGQWNSIAGKDRYRFSSRSCRTLRALGCACTATCELHEAFQDSERKRGRKLPTKRAYDWGKDTRIVIDQDLVAPLTRDEILNHTDDVLGTLTPGAGKTHGAGMAVRVLAATQEPTIYSGPTHKLATQFSDLVPNAVVKQGRNEKTCERAALASQVASRGWGAVRTVCLDCPSFNSKNPLQSACKWWQQWGEGMDKPWIVTHAHLATGVPQTHYPATRIILDEDVVSACLGWAGGLEGGFGPGVLEEVARAYSSPAWDWEPTPTDWLRRVGFDDDPGPAAQLCNLLAARLRSFETGTNPLIQSAASKKGSATDWLSEGGDHVGMDAILPLLMDDWGRLDDELVAWAEQVKDLGWTAPEYVPDRPTDMLPPAVLPALVNAVLEAARLWRAHQAGQTYAKGIAPVALHLGPPDKESGARVALLRLRTFRPLPLGSARVVAMDATAAPDITARAVGRDHLRHLDLVVETKGVLHQIADARLPKATIQASKGKSEQWAERIVKIVEQVQEAHGGTVLVITYMLMEGRLLGRWKKDPRFRVRHFWGIRGEDHSDVSAVVLVGYPSPRFGDVQLDGAAIWEGKDIDTAIEEGWRPYLEVGMEDEPESKGLEVLEPVDPRLRALWRARSDAEFWQSIHRGRPARRPEVATYILSQVPMLPEYREAVVLGDLRTMEGLAKSRQSVSSRVGLLADSLSKRLGWVTLRLLEAVLTGPEEGNPIYRRGGYIDLLIPDPALNPREVSKLLSRAADLRRSAGLESMTRPRIREAWSAYASPQGWHEVTLHQVGKRGRPYRDAVVGSIEAWMYDWGKVIKLPDLAVKVDGREVTEVEVEALSPIGGPGTGTDSLRFVVDIGAILDGDGPVDRSPIPRAWDHLPYIVVADDREDDVEDQQEQVDPVEEIG